MTLKSMTGFGRAEGARTNSSGDQWQWHWEIKTVNARGLDIRLRMPPGLDAVERDVRKALQTALRRGACQVALTLERSSDTAQVRVNEELAARLTTDLQALAHKLGTPSPTLDAVLSIRGVVEVAEEPVDETEAAAREAAITKSFGDAVESLLTSRTDEGNKLHAVLEAVLLETETLVNRAADLAATTPQELQARLEEQVHALLADRAEMPADRIIQEVALLAGKADIREELDRLRTHIMQARDLLASGEAVGRKLDFLAQEFNREANTLCSKSSNSELTRIGLDMKAAIEQLREQVQNVE